MTRARTLRVLKWATTVLLLVIVIVGGLSCLWAVRDIGPQITWGVIGATVVRSPSAWFAFTDPPTPGGFHAWWCPCFCPFGGLPRGDQGFVIIPLWIPAVALAPFVAVSWLTGRRKFPRGHCQTCGYDLTGNVSGRCPECGELL